MRNRLKMILLISVLLFAGILALGWYQTRPQGPLEKDEASKYFEVVRASLDEGVPGGENSSVFIIVQVSFTLKAVKGDAHNVLVYGWIGTELFPTDGQVGAMPKGEERQVIIMSSPPYGYRSILNADGKYPVKIRLTSSEAEGYLTLLL